MRVDVIEEFVSVARHGFEGFTVFDGYERSRERVSLHRRKLQDPHKAADDFLSASDVRRAEMREEAKADLRERVANYVAPAQPHARPGRPSRCDIHDPSMDVERVKSLHRAGLSNREIERRTGWGRMRVARALRGDFDGPRKKIGRPSNKDRQVAQ